MSRLQNKNKFIYLFGLTIFKNLFTNILFIFNLLICFFVMSWQKTRLVRSLFSFSQCRFYPSCSDYFYQSFKKHGLVLGLLLSVKRLLKCHPLCEGGVDEVPS